MWHLLLKNKQKNHNYVVLNYKCTAKKTIGQWMDIYITGDQGVKLQMFRIWLYKNCSGKSDKIFAHNSLIMGCWLCENKYD